ncbi:hypothetical protein YTPLAS18_23960 [Nitrospira sp.]|nr:hypothetical protein YTPLAS18_23960 [Nitrospira sp.]
MAQNADQSTLTGGGPVILRSAVETGGEVSGLMDTGPSREQRVYNAVFGCLVVLQLCPIWFSPYPAMHDYPNHLARAVILHDYGAVAFYQTQYEYEPNWWLIPNLAMDLLVPLLMTFAGVEVASRLFLSLTVLVFAAGVHLLGTSVNARPHWSAVVSTFFLYNFFWPMGLLNYLFGLGVFFIALAFWLRSRSEWTWGRYLLMTLLAASCYVAHLSAFIFLGVAAVCVTGLDVLKTKQVRIQHLLDFIPLVPPVVAYLWYTSGIARKDPMQWWDPILIKKATGLAYPFLSYDAVLDGTLGVTFVGLMLLSWKYAGSPRLVREMVVAGGVLFVLYLIAPMSGGVASTYVDRRIIIPAAVLLVLALRIDVSRRVARAVLAGLIVLCAVRAAEVWYYWNRIGTEVAAQVQMLERMPEEARVYPMFVHDRSMTADWLWDMHFYHTAHYGTIYRHAFVPTLYAWHAAFPIHLRSPDTGYMPTERETTVDQVNWTPIFTRYDYIWGYNLSSTFKHFLVSHGDVIVERGPTMLIRITKESPPG